MAPACIRLLFSLIPFLPFSIAQYDPSWSSLDTRQIPTWWDDAKFGIKIHWGVYSVPSWAPVGSYAEWYWFDQSNTSSATSAFHNKTYGANFKYPDFVSSFHAELFSPSDWASLFFKSGARYVVPTSKHHDGYALWDSKESWNWNSVDTGPHKPLLNLLFEQVRNFNMSIGFYYSLYEWFHPLYISEDPKRYVLEVMIPQLTDLVNTLKPDIVFADGEWDHPSAFWETEQFVAWLFNESPVKDHVVINDRWGNETRNTHGGYYTPEYNATAHLDHKWEESMGVDLHSFGLNRNTPADKYWSSSYLVNVLVRNVANNGNLLLNVGPSADGTINPIMQERLLDIGSWLSVNGESIYGSRIWRVQNEWSPTIPKEDQNLDNASIRYTRSNENVVNQTVYAHILQWPDSNQVYLDAPIVSSASRIILVGEEKSGSLTFTSSPSNGITVNLPSLTPNTKTKYVWVLKMDNIL